MCVCVRVYTVKSVSNTCCYCCRYHLVALFYLPHLFVPRVLTCSPLVFPFVDFHGAKVLISLCFYPCYCQPLYSLSLVLLLLGCLSTLPGVLIYCGLVKCRQRLHFNPHQPPLPSSAGNVLCIFVELLLCYLPLFGELSRQETEKRFKGLRLWTIFFWGQSMKIVSGDSPTVLLLMQV